MQEQPPKNSDSQNDSTMEKIRSAGPSGLKAGLMGTALFFSEPTQPATPEKDATSSMEAIEAMKESVIETEKKIVTYAKTEKMSPLKHLGAYVKTLEAQDREGAGSIRVMIGYKDKKGEQPIWIIVENSDATIRYSDNLDGIPEKYIHNKGTEYQYVADRQKENDQIMVTPIDNLGRDQLATGTMPKRDLFVSQIEYNTDGELISFEAIKSINFSKVKSYQAPDGSIKQTVDGTLYKGDRGLTELRNIQQSFVQILVPITQMIDEKELEKNNDQVTGMKE